MTGLVEIPPEEFEGLEAPVEQAEQTVGEAAVTEVPPNIEIPKGLYDSLMRQRVLQLIRGSRMKAVSVTKAQRKAKRKAQKKARQVTRAK